MSLFTEPELSGQPWQPRRRRVLSCASVCFMKCGCVCVCGMGFGDMWYSLCQFEGHKGKGRKCVFRVCHILVREWHVPLFRFLFFLVSHFAFYATNQPTDHAYEYASMLMSTHLVIQRNV